MFTSREITWTWQSIRPGISVRPPQSITSASGALIGLSETSLDRVALDEQLVAAAQLADLGLEHLEVHETAAAS